jgi:hypothetical protein
MSPEKSTCSKPVCSEPVGEDGVLCEAHRFEYSLQFHEQSAN